MLLFHAKVVATVIHKLEKHYKTRMIE
jgi:hypothetical protein